MPWSLKCLHRRWAPQTHESSSDGPWRNASSCVCRTGPSASAPLARTSVCERLTRAPCQSRASSALRHWALSVRCHWPSPLPASQPVERSTNFSGRKRRWLDFRIPAVESTTELTCRSAPKLARKIDWRTSAACFFSFGSFATGIAILFFHGNCLIAITSFKYSWKGKYPWWAKHDKHAFSLCFYTSTTTLDKKKEPSSRFAARRTLFHVWYRAQSGAISAGQKSRTVADWTCPALIAPDRAWYHTWNSVLLAANLDDGSLFFLSRVVADLLLELNVQTHSAMPSTRRTQKVTNPVMRTPTCTHAHIQVNSQMVQADSQWSRFALHKIHSETNKIHIEMRGCTKFMAFNDSSSCADESHNLNLSKESLSFLHKINVMS